MHHIQNYDALILCAGLLALSDILAGQFTSGLWSGYLLFASSMGWAVDGIGGAIFTIVIGLTGSALVRVMLAERFNLQPTSPRNIVDLFIARIVTLGIGVICIDVVFTLLGGTVPIAVFEAQNILAILFAFTAGIAGVSASGLLLLNPEERSHLLTKLYWRYRSPIQIIQEYVLLLLVPCIVVVYFNFSVFLFFISIIAIAAQSIRYKLFMGVKDSLELRVDELVMLDTFSREIVSNIAIDSLLRKIYDYISQMTPVSTFTVALYDDSTQIISFPLIMKNGEEQEQLDVHIEHIPVIGKLKTQKKPTESSTQSSNEGLEWHEIESAFIGVPLHVGEKFIGALCLSSGTSVGFGVDEKRIILTISTQMSLVLRNAILFERSVSTSQKLARIYQFVQEVVLNNNREDIFLRSAEIINSLFDAQVIVFFTRDVDKNEYIVAYEHKLDVGVIELLKSWVNSQSSIGNISTYPDLATSNDKLLIELQQITGYQTVTEVMLQSSSIHEGLVVILHNHIHHYNVAELDILKTLVLQISAALDNADLLHALESYASEQAQLVLFSRTLTASLDIEVVIEDIQLALTSMLNADTIAIGINGKDTGETLQFRVYSEENGHHGKLIAVEHDLSFDNSVPIITTVDNCDETVKYLLDALSIHGDALIAPLIANQKLLGMIIVESEQSFSPSNIRFLELASNHASTHIHTVQQYNYIEYALEKRLQQLAMIEDIAKNISATLDVNQLIEHVLDAAVQATQADVAILGLVADYEQLVIHGRYFSEGSWHDLDFVQSINEGTMGRVAQTGSPVLLYRNANSAEYLTVVEDQDYLSSLVVPLVKDNHIRGVINLESLQESFFNTDHMEFISSLADHAVISLQNTYLLNERQQQINTLTQLRKLSLESIGAGSQEVVIDAVLETALEIIPADFAVMNTIDAESNELIDSNVKGKNADQVDQIEVLVPENVLEVAYTHNKVMNIADVSKSDLYGHFWNIKDIAYKSIIVIPLTDQDGKTKQVMCLLFKQIHGNLESFSSTIELLSIQASGFLHNANLYEQIISGNNRMTAILDATSNGIILLDRNGRLLQTNPSAERILDMSLYEHVGESFINVILYRLQDVGAIASEEAREGLQKMARILRLEPERITRQQYALPHRDGSQIYVEEIGSPVMSSDYEIIGRLLVIRDMTEQKQLESYRDEVTHMIIHDLRSPLGTILGSLAVSLDIIKDPQGMPIEDIVTPVLDVSVTTTERLLRLVDSILDISKLENRSMPLNLQPTDVHDIIQLSIKSMQRSLEESNIEVSVKHGEDIPKVTVDADKIERVIINLLDNALRYTPLNGQVMVETESVQKGKFVLVRISDSGPGIPEDQQDKIFAKFSQVKGSMPQRGSKGSGLGLTFCKLTVEAHGGSIKVEPNGPLSGASFVFTLPSQ